MAGSSRLRRLSRLARVGADAVVLSAALWLAFLLRFEGDIPHEYVKRLFFLWPYVVGLQLICLQAVGAPDFAWRYIGLREASRLLYATGGAATVLLSMRLVGEMLLPMSAYVMYAILPVGVILIDLMVAFLGVAGTRAVWRSLIERAGAAGERADAGPEKRTLLVGAGQVGLWMAKEIERRPGLGIHAVGFVDDTGGKTGQLIHGLRVLGTPADIPALGLKHRIDQALITVSEPPGSLVRRVHERCKSAGIETKVAQGLHETAGQLGSSKIRPVTIEDLLRRDPVQLDSPHVQSTIHDSCVMITGAGGSIGLGLCEQTLLYSPRRLLLVERAEGNLFQAHQHLLAKFPDHADRIHPLIADIGDEARLDEIFTRYKPSLVLHAAAHKHVPMMEWNVGEAIKNNIIGTRALADAAQRHDVDRFVMVSTDKAVNPSSVMGCTKRLAEMYVQALSQESKTRFVTVRFGNVLGSTGSVVPIFQKQIQEGGPVVVTHPDMKRYFMTVPEACQLVLEASSIGKGGEIFILDMGEPVRIVDLAKDLIRLSGLKPEQDIAIEFSGTRPGEKLYEELSVSEEVADKTRHPKIFIGHFRPADRSQLNAALNSLESDCRSAEEIDLLDRLASLVPEFSPDLGDDEASENLAQLRAAGR
ncbi:MAG: nucleoside-diphosphate sugar epimerase/dehydratase [Candidatus Binatia bacterium]|nr:nucleoside-diphosphate sugar epimerase/dehydratase [Candidatus Binatia bacterium]